MKASVGDRLVVHGRVVGRTDRYGEIIEVRGADGQSPCHVRHDDGHEALAYPGPDAMVEHRTEEA